MGCERERLTLYINNTNFPLINMQQLKHIIFQDLLNEPRIKLLFVQAWELISMKNRKIKKQKKTIPKKKKKKKGNKRKRLKCSKNRLKTKQMQKFWGKTGIQTRIMLIPNCNILYRNIKMKQIDISVLILLRHTRQLSIWLTISWWSFSSDSKSMVIHVTLPEALVQLH